MRRARGPIRADGCDRWPLATVCTFGVAAADTDGRMGRAGGSRPHRRASILALRLARPTPSREQLSSSVCAAKWVSVAPEASEWHTEGFGSLRVGAHAGAVTATVPFGPARPSA